MLLAANPHRISISLANRLWERLRNRQVAGHHFSRNQAIGRKVADFYCAEVGVIVQIESRHTPDRGVDARADHFELEGYRVVRVSEIELIDDMAGAVRRIGDELRVAPLDRVTMRPKRVLS